MKRLIKHLYMLAVMAAGTGVMASCDMMEQDLDDCPYGLYVNFKYDYNLQRADMFNDHVGSVTLYIFDEDGNLVKTQEESNVGGVSPLSDPGYAMHITDLAPGHYQFIALAGQKPYGDMLETTRAKFVRNDMAAGASMQSLEINLDKGATVTGPDGATYYSIENNGLPLDTLWHGMMTEPVEVYPMSSNRAAYATVPLVRDTKHINVALRELDDPTVMDIAKYDMYITDHNSRILWDNALDETDPVIYTPYSTWNSDDRTPPTSPGDGDVIEGVGKIGHADFMTSRLIYHDNAENDGHLYIRNKETGIIVANLNLPDILSRLRTSDELHAYSEQEFLDRGYDYQITVFLRGDKLEYINISISVLGWSKRIQWQEL